MFWVWRVQDPDTTGKMIFLNYVSLLMLALFASRHITCFLLARLSSCSHSKTPIPRLRDLRMELLGLKLSLVRFRPKHGAKGHLAELWFFNKARS